MMKVLEIKGQVLMMMLSLMLTTSCAAVYGPVKTAKMYGKYADRIKAACNTPDILK